MDKKFENKQNTGLHLVPNPARVRADLTDAPSRETAPESTSSGGGAQFVLAEATDTRLMGVTGLHLHHRFDEDDVHQFFLLDAEEFGLEEYEGMAGNDPDAVTAQKISMFGGLGGKWKEITREEALFLLRSHFQINAEEDIPLPGDPGEYEWLLNAGEDLEPPAFTTLMDKICVRIQNNTELVNYYLMRCCGKDYPALRYLCTPDGLTDVIDAPEPASLCKNEVSLVPGFRNRYRAESLIEYDDAYSFAVSIVETRGKKVIGAELVSIMPISDWEASNILRREEFLIDLQNTVPIDKLAHIIAVIFPTMTASRHDLGSLYMIFAPDNSHVRDAHYRLDNDTLASIYVLDSGEVVVAGSHPNVVGNVADALITAADVSGFGKMKTITSIRFPHPMLGLFLDSGAPSFREFMAYIQDSFE
ncbi:MAG: hypothetical protein IIY82_05820 [Firmicutes bacterium]|nr:hypothetical protein [Bacillota bacterium]